MHVEVDMDITVENMQFSSELNNKSSPRFQNLSSSFKKEVSLFGLRISYFIEHILVNVCFVICDVYVISSEATRR